MRLKSVDGSNSDILILSQSSFIQHVIFSLNDKQVEFIRKYIPSDVKIYLVGHSIGAYMSLQLMKFDDISERIHHCYLLFPTLEYMV